ncbi:hypothetical protein QU38_01655, partial [Staphylococcus aureus]
FDDRAETSEFSGHCACQRTHGGLALGSLAGATGADLDHPRALEKHVAATASGLHPEGALANAAFDGDLGIVGGAFGKLGGRDFARRRRGCEFDNRQDKTGLGGAIRAIAELSARIVVTLGTRGARRNHWLTQGCGGLRVAGQAAHIQ